VQIPGSEAVLVGAGTLRWALGADPTSLDPRLIVRDEDALVVDALFDSLTRLGPGLTPRPALALSWVMDDDARRFTFTLDPAARWHDGTPVVAQDVVRGLERVADGTIKPPSIHAPLLHDVEGFNVAQSGRGLRGVSAAGDHTLVITLTVPDPELATVLAHPALAPVPASAVTDSAAFGESPVGNGPFALGDRWAHNQFLRLVPSLMHPAPDSVGEVVFRIYADDEDRTVRYGDLVAGQLQVATIPLGGRETARSAFGTADATGGQGVREALTDTVSLLVLDTTQAPFDDERFRRGVSMLVDRQALASRTDGSRSVASGIVPPTFPGAQAQPCRWCDHDPETAARLIAAALAARPSDAVPLAPIVIQTSPDALHGALADQLSVSLRGFGLAVQIVRPNAERYLRVAESAGPAVIRLGWTPAAPTLQAWITELLAGGTPVAQLSGWQPDALVALLARASSAVDAAARQTALQEVERLALDSAVIAPVLFYRQDMVVGPGVAGLFLAPDGSDDLAAVRLTGTAP
jgi:oligopeptide transport system substrate-binding protein